MEVEIQPFIEAMHLETLYDPGKSFWELRSADLNRPGLQFTGFYDYFAYQRPQVIGLTEMSYLESLDAETLRTRLEKFFSYDLPCVVICRGMNPPDIMLEFARARQIAVYLTRSQTTVFSVAAINYLSRVLAPCSTVHGVLLDVYGVGILITGDSGVGKSEAALELIKRGHQLTADDSVIIRKVSQNRLIGEAPESIRHFMEIRGIGIIDVKAMFGIGAVLMSKSIDLVIHLEPWNETKSYDRLGLDESYTEIMGVRIAQLLLPVKPGRNLAIIIEVAARNFSLRRLGYSAAQELNQRLNDQILKNRDQNEPSGGTL